MRRSSIITSYKSINNKLIKFRYFCKIYFLYSFINLYLKENSLWIHFRLCTFLKWLISAFEFLVATFCNSRCKLQSESNFLHFNFLLLMLLNKNKFDKI